MTSTTNLRYYSSAYHTMDTACVYHKMDNSSSAYHNKPVPRKKVGNHTWLERDIINGEEVIHAVFHQTRVVTAWKDGTVSLNTGGWDTATTRDRMAYWSGVRLHSIEGGWCMGVWVTNAQAAFRPVVSYWVPLSEGVRFDPTTLLLKREAKHA